MGNIYHKDFVFLGGKFFIFGFFYTAKFTIIIKNDQSKKLHTFNF